MVPDLQSIITVGLDYLRMSKGGGYQDFDQGDFGHVSSEASEIIVSANFRTRGKVNQSQNMTNLRTSTKKSMSRKRIDNSGKVLHELEHATVT